LGVPVLIHSTKKPSASCIKEIYAYFDSLNAAKLEPSSSLRNTNTEGSTPGRRRLVVCGDRLLTDVLLANQMGPETLAVWTQRLWKRRDVTVLRTLEKLVLRLVIAFKGEDPHKKDTAQYVRGSLVAADPVQGRLNKCIATLSSIWQRLSRN
jgi:predicted HAD superfamily phosphohydrolase YqeG